MVRAGLPIRECHCEAFPSGPYALTQQASWLPAVLEDFTSPSDRAALRPLAHRQPELVESGLRLTPRHIRSALQLKASLHRPPAEMTRKGTQLADLRRHGSFVMKLTKRRHPVARGQGKTASHQARLPANHVDNLSQLLASAFNNAPPVPLALVGELLHPAHVERRMPS